MCNGSRMSVVLNTKVQGVQHDMVCQEVLSKYNVQWTIWYTGYSMDVQYRAEWHTYIRYVI